MYITLTITFKKPISEYNITRKQMNNVGEDFYYENGYLKDASTFFFYNSYPLFKGAQADDIDIIETGGDDKATYLELDIEGEVTAENLVSIFYKNLITQYPIFEGKVESIACELDNETTTFTY